MERTSQWACESYLDAAAHSVSRLGFREARDNKVLFVILFKNGVISESTSQAMVKISKFRNIVVHDYARIDPEIVIGTRILSYLHSTNDIGITSGFFRYYRIRRHGLN